MKKGRVFLIVGDPRTGKSDLRTKLADLDFFKENGIVVQDISPDGEGSWIIGKSKDEIRMKRDRFKPYTPEYYKGAKEAIIDAKNYLRLFIADMGGKPNPDEFGISDKDEFLKNADGYIVLKKKNSEWDSFIKKMENKIIIEYSLPEEEVSKEAFNEILKNISVDLVDKLDKDIESKENYEQRIKTYIESKGYIPVNLFDYYTSDGFCLDALVNIPSLPFNPKYCIYGKAPVVLAAKLLLHNNQCAIFDPKLRFPIVEIPIKERIVSKIVEYTFHENELTVMTPRFIKIHDVPLLKLENNVLRDRISLNCGGPVWMQIDLFFQLKDATKEIGLYNKREGKIIWLN